MAAIKESKDALDKIIKKSRVHLYKPIQIAEILYRHRMTQDVDISNLETFRNPSKKWRDEVTMELVGRVSTSSAKFQDNLFENNAMPIKFFEKLAEENKLKRGIVENYIYHCLEKRLTMVTEAREYIKKSKADKFSLKDFLCLFVSKPGLKRSIDKAYEITVYALFAAIVKALKAKVTISLDSPDQEILEDFHNFTQLVLGIDGLTQTKELTAQLYRVGVTNAADRGLDMFTNFGPVIQVKHLSLTSEIAEDIMESSNLDNVLIVCLDADKYSIENLLQQTGWAHRIQGIITLSDLEKWYSLALSAKHSEKLGKTLLTSLEREFMNEFPSSEHLEDFLLERGYDSTLLTGEWAKACD